MLEVLDELFESATIKPTFKHVHIILALYIFGENQNGIGRYRLQKELLIGSGTARSLITKLNKNIEFITVADVGNTKGHVLTKEGLQFLITIKEKIPLLKKVEETDLKILKNIIIKSEYPTSQPYFCLVKNSAKALTNGIAQRDAAIKINGTGATCLVHNGQDLIFPSKISESESEREQMGLNNEAYEYFETQVKEANLNLERNDVIIIGLGNTSKISRLAALNAALTLL